MEHDGVCKSLPLGSTSSQTNPIHAFFLWDILCIFLPWLQLRLSISVLSVQDFVCVLKDILCMLHSPPISPHVHTQCTTIWDTLKAVMARSVLFWQESWNSIKVRCIFIQDLFPDHVLRGLAELRLRAILEPGHILCSRPRPWSGIRLNLSNPDICHRRAISTESNRVY
jgi:hypothetical protein